MTGVYRLRDRRVPGWVTSWALPICLYLFAACLLLFRLNQHPNFTYNWENNTLRSLYPFVEQPSLAPFKLLEGLMTDSGRSPWVLFPAWLTFGLAGSSLMALRAPVALLAAFAVPLVYLLSMKVAQGGSRAYRVSQEATGEKPEPGAARSKWPMPLLSSVTAALLLAMSPAYLLYARTATVVGVSLVPMLLSALVLVAVLARPDLWWRSAAVLGTLMIGGYAYAPVRFMWPLCIGLLLLEAVITWKDRRRRWRLIASALLIAVGMSAFIAALDYEHEHDLRSSIGGYYSVRGEHIVLLIEAAQEAEAIQAEAGLDKLANGPTIADRSWQLIGKNAGDLLNLLLDKGTLPALTDYWNPNGRLYPGWMLPLLAAGFVRACLLGLRRVGYRWRVVVALFLIFTLPMILTTQVHIGRLIFSVPIICLLVAHGLTAIIDALSWVLERVARRRQDRQDMKIGINRPLRALAALLFTLVLLGGAAWSVWQDYRIEVPPTYEELVTRILRARVDEVRERGGGVALVVGKEKDIVMEEIAANQYRLMLRDLYRFYNVARADVDLNRPGDTRPLLLIGGLQDRLKEPGAIPEFCNNLYYVAPRLLEEIDTLISGYQVLCSAPIEIRSMP